MSAPSFASFPPSFSSFPDDEPGPSTTVANKKDRKHRKDERERDRKSKKHKHEKRDESQRHRKDPVRDEDDNTTRLFFSDKRPDPSNLQYGGPDKKDVPRYKCVSRGKAVLGLPSMTVLYRQAHSVEIGNRKAYSHGPSLTDSATYAVVTKPALRRIAGTETQENDDEQDHDFVRIAPKRKAKAKAEQWSILDKSDVDSSASGSDEEESSASGDDVGEILRTSQQEALKSLEEQLSRNPNSPAVWLKLLEISISDTPVTPRKARAEITLSILSSAMASDPRNSTNALLRLGYLRAGEQVWEPNQLQEEWENAYRNAGTVQIWMEWLDWKLRTEGIACVVEAARRVLDSIVKKDGDELSQLRVFWRVASAFREAGFAERATAMFQAQAELMFEIPQALYGLPFPILLNKLEEFWDSEVPRLGEVNSRGWAQWVSSGKKEAHPSTSNIPSTLPPRSDRYRRWAIRELHSDSHSFIPTKALDQADDEEWDPYSTIVLSDIRPLLLDLQDPFVKNTFRICWLSFLGLHVPGFTLDNSDEQNGWDDRWTSTHLSSPSHLTALFPPRDQVGPTAQSVSGVLVGRERQYAKGPIPIKSWGYRVFDALDATTHMEGLWGKIDVQDVDTPFIQRVFSQLRLGGDDWEWDALSLAFEATISVKNALKLSQTYLSDARDSLPHWAAHAHLQRRREKFIDARKVYMNVLGATPSLPSRLWLARMWWDWAEMEWLAKQSDAARTVILKAAGVEGSGNIALLRAKRVLEENVNAPGVEWKDQEAWLKLRALLELIGSGNMEQALSVLDGRALDGVAAESMAVSALLLIYRHSVVLKNPSPPSILRERASKALELYPSNSIVLELFLEGEKGQSVWGRVRDMYAEKPGVSDKGVERRLQEVWVSQWQIGQWLAEVERIRKGLAGAVESDRTKHSSALWRTYIELEVRAGNLKRARDLFWRAIIDCPMSKELYLLAFDPLRRVFTPHELAQLVSTMAERGLRMRTEPDEEGDLEGGAESDNNGDSDGDSEIEEDARELRRLMPY